MQIPCLSIDDNRLREVLYHFLAYNLLQSPLIEIQRFIKSDYLLYAMRLCVSSDAMYLPSIGYKN